MNFRQASKIVIPFGKFKGKTIDDISATSEGLVYLDWLLDQDWFEEKFSTAFSAAKTYLDDQSVQHDLRAVIGDDDFDDH